jgi:hypothetical protein
MIPKPILITGTLIVNRADLIFCHCPVCLNEVNWRHTDASFGLYAECCCHVFQAAPANSKLSMYRVEAKPADMTNVYWLFRGSEKQVSPKPPNPPMRFA